MYRVQVNEYIIAANGNGRIILGGNFHIDSFNGNDIYVNYYNNARFRVWNGSSSERFRVDTDGIVYAFQELRTPILYDYNDTTYRFDGNGTSVLNYSKLRNAYDWEERRFTNPQGGTFTTSTSSITGAIRLFLPADRRRSNTMLRMTVKVYEYNTGNSHTFNVGGYNYYTGQWYNVFATQLTDSGKGALIVRFGDDGSRQWITIGEAGTTWTYPQVHITDVEVGYSGFSSNWGQDWVVNFGGIPGGENSSRTASLVLTSNNASSNTADVYGGNAYFSRYYDRDNTGYYVDPASTSLMYDVRAYNRLYIGSSTSNLNINYDQIWRPDGGQIHIGYSAANNIQLNNGGGYTYSLTSLRAPIFYNYSNTGYYADFDSTGTSINIAGSVNAATYNKPGLLVNASGTSSSGGALGIQQVTSEGWTGIFVDFEPYTGWGLWHDNPNNYFSFTAEASTGQIRSFTVPSRQSGNRTAYEKFRVDQNSGDVIIGRDGYAQSSFRAPIFYDTDTSYYVDPNGTTNIRYLKVNTTGTSSGTRALTIKSDGQGEINFGSYPASWSSALQIQNNNNTDFIWISPLDDGYNARFRTGGTGLDFYTDGGNNTGTYSGFIGSGYVQGIDSIRGPIFYDSNDTTYRVDPNGDSRIWQLGIGYGLPGKRLDVIGDHGTSAMRVQLPASNNGAGTGIVRLGWIWI